MNFFLISILFSSIICNPSFPIKHCMNEAWPIRMPIKIEFNSNVCICDWNENRVLFFNLISSFFLSVTLDNHDLILFIPFFPAHFSAGGPAITGGQPFNLFLLIPSNYKSVHKLSLCWIECRFWKFKKKF